MKQVSTKFKNQIKELGREIDSIITYYNHYKFITEDNQYILTEDGQKILTEQINRDNVVEITAEDIYNEKIITHGDILSTMMKEFDFEVKQEMQIGSILNVKFGVKVNSSYEYIDYGDFIVNQKEYKEDTKTYSYKAYDFMLLTMTPFKAPDLSEVSGEYTIYDLFNYICSYCHLNNGVEMFANSERQYYNVNSLEELGYTNRDILDFISEISGSSIVVNNYNVEVLTPNNTTGNNLQSADQLYQKMYAHNSTYLTQTTDDDIEVIEFVNTIYRADVSNPFNMYDNWKENTQYTIRGMFRRTSENNGALYIQIFYTDGTRKQVSGNNTSWTQFRIVSDVNKTIDRVGFGFGDSAFWHLDKSSWFIGEGVVSEYEPYDLLTLKEDSFKDTNVNFNKVYGPINSILFSRSEGTDVIEIKDEESIKENGVTQIKIKDNPFLEDNDRSDYQEELFDVLNGLTYTLNDLDSIGITYLDYYDKYKVQIGENTYDCLLLNDEISINQGLEEKIFTEEYEGTTQEYVTSRLSDKDQKWANIQVKKDLGEISLEVGQKVNSDEIITAINLSPEQAEINSSKVSLQGKTINLTSDTINIASNNFSVDTSGNMTCNDATMNNATMNNASVVGGSISLTGDASTNAKFVIYSSSSNTNRMELMPNFARFYKNGTELIQIATYMTTPFIVVGNYSAIGQASTLQPDGIHTQSDIRLKENIEDIKEENSIKFITSLNPIEYTFKKSKIYHKGLSAQDVEEKSENQKTKIYSKDKDGYYTINYVELIPDLINCIKYQQEEIEKLKERIDNK